MKSLIRPFVLVATFASALVAGAGCHEYDDDDHHRGGHHRLRHDGRYDRHDRHDRHHDRHHDHHGHDRRW